MQTTAAKSVSAIGTTTLTMRYGADREEEQEHSKAVNVECSIRAVPGPALP